MTSIPFRLNSLINSEFSSKAFRALVLLAKNNHKKILILLFVYAAGPGLGQESVIFINENILLTTLTRWFVILPHITRLSRPSLGSNTTNCDSKSYRNLVVAGRLGRSWNLFSVKKKLTKLIASLKSINPLRKLPNGQYDEHQNSEIK